MIRTLLITASLCALSLTVQAKQSYKIAITNDDLPDHGSATPNFSRLDIAKAHIAAYAKFGVPKVYGFVNARALEYDPESAAVLSLWVSSGHLLGNHAYSHANADAGTVADFQKETLTNEPVLAVLMQGKNWHYFRYPFLNPGNAEHYGPIKTFLLGRGYKIAEVSMSFDDWAYTDVYNRCVAKGDQAAIATLKDRYLKGVDIAIKRSTLLSQKLYGRQIPQVLLTHIGGFSAVMIDDTLSHLKASGAEFVTLDEAQSDAAYADNPTYGQNMMLERQAREKGVDMSDLPAMPSVNDFGTMCR